MRRTVSLVTVAAVMLATTAAPALAAKGGFGVCHNAMGVTASGQPLPCAPANPMRG